ncbi:MAG: hypothetical protein Q4D04_03180 [Clostridia bacterium]|nr:hypothetical protein [Clostridia bacterium]
MYEQFLLSLPELFGQVFRGIFIIIVIGSMAYPFGQMLPRKSFDYTAFPYTPFKIEDNGRFYLKFKIQLWKDKVPDMSLYFRHSFRKKITVFRDPEYIEALIRETCVAEFVHFILILISPIFLHYLQSPVSWIMIILYILGNVPFIMIQRYNRPRLVGILNKQRELIEKRKLSANQAAAVRGE